MKKPEIVEISGFCWRRTWDSNPFQLFLVGIMRYQEIDGSVGISRVQAPYALKMPMLLKLGFCESMPLFCHSQERAMPLQHRPLLEMNGYH